MSTIIASFCLDNDESIVIRHDVNQRYIGIKIPSRSGYVWIKNAEFEALREGLWLMEERVISPSPAIERAVCEALIEEIEDIDQSRDVEEDGGGYYWCTSCEMTLEEPEQKCGCIYIYEKRKQRLAMLKTRLAALDNL
jgi:hypothetical protein